MSYPGLPANYTTNSQFPASAENAVENAVNALSAFSTKTSAYTLTLLDQTICADPTAASFTLTLPTAVGCTGKQYLIKKSDSIANVNTVTIATTSSQTIGGATTHLLVFNGQRVAVVSNGSNWTVTDSNYAGTQLGYAELDSSYSFSNSSASASYKAPGLSVTTVGTGRPVSVRFSGQAYSTTANAFVAVSLLVNGVAVGGAPGGAGIAVCSTPIAGYVRSLSFEASPILASGVSYTFEVSPWVQSSYAGVLYADATTPMPITFIVEGQ